MHPNPSEGRVTAWLIGAFLICPCHLPLTLALVGSLLAGTAAGALLSGHPYIPGSIVSMAWVAVTWRAIQYLRLPRALPTSLPPAPKP